MKEYTANGIMYTWELAGSAGASFILFPEPLHTKDQIEEAKNWLRYQHDVVSLTVAKDDHRDYLYKGDIFRVPETRPLRWYEINQDEKLLRQERLKGTSPEDFVKLFVLPNIEKIKKQNIEKFGADIINF